MNLIPQVAVDILLYKNHLEQIKNMTTKISFDDWIEQLDDYVITKVGVSIHDLSDCPYRDYFDEDLTIKEAYDCMTCDCDDLEHFLNL